MAGFHSSSSSSNASRQSKRQSTTLAVQPPRPSVRHTCEDERCRAPRANVWHCVDCDSSYCDECWTFQGPHKPGKLGRDGVPHEKTDPQVVARLKDILQPPASAERLRRLHEEDKVSKWFGMVRDQNERPTLEDYGRYASLMGSLQPLDESKDRFPQLVSFIGTTNAGKSTIIKMLINHMPSGEDPPSLFPTPIVGSTLHDKVPTSGDVHLYADQSTHAGQLPVLYADCEGFEGGEKLPMGARLRKRADDGSNEIDAELAQSRRFPIEWADNENSSRREFAVTELYPRLLYTFSDVVVFVLRNPKTFQSSVLTKLLQWGASALETSINQPALPHAIVLLNDADPQIDPREWDTAYATDSLLACLTESLSEKEGVPLFRQLARRWRDVGVEITCIEDLILRYYSTFKVIRMPRKPQYSLMERQIRTLHAEIRANCEISFWAKRKARMLTTSEELNTYLQSAFDHYARTLTIPFNFVQVSWLNNPITYDFGGHLLQLANTIAALEPALRRDHSHSQWIFDQMSILIASCIMLDCARHRKGQIKDLFDKYREYFEWALNEYCDMSLPCAFSTADGRECQLVKARHAAKGHQDNIGIIAPGDFVARFDAQQYFVRWEEQLRGAINDVQKEFHDEHVQVAKGGVHLSDEKIALELHRQYLGDFYRSVSVGKPVLSHASCFCCLLDIAEHPLPCGHVLCSNCVQSYGHDRGRGILDLTTCPLHTEDLKWSPPHEIQFKPNGAGVRILCMEGGGVRGIVQLEVLRAIEQVLGGEIMIRSFFDLMVGTGTGGIIALALGIERWSVAKTSEMFDSLCDQAYATRLAGTPLIDIAAVMGYGSKYRTRAFQNALKDAFGKENDLFGGKDSFGPGQRVKVALTATNSTADKAILLANYRRKEYVYFGHELERPHDPKLELKVFEAAAATSAAPTFFKPFVHPKTNRTYLDGAVLNNNPARLANEERTMIWPDTIGQDPDILLSLGTGQNRIEVLPKLSQRKVDQPQLRSSMQQLTKMKSRTLGRLFRQYSKVDDILDAELAWASFRSEVIKGDSAGGRNQRRYVRFNPDLDKAAPAMDAKDHLRSLQAIVRRRLQLPHCKTALEHVAHRLIATCFYYEVKSKTVNPDGTQCFTGHICCRFRDGSDELTGLGKYLQRLETEFFQPHLVVNNQSRPDRTQIIDIPHDSIENMAELSTFNNLECSFAVEDVAAASSVNILLTPYDGLEPNGFPISGFPRILADDLVSHVQRAIRRAPSSLDTTSLSALGTAASFDRSESSSEPSLNSPLGGVIGPGTGTPISPRPEMKRYRHPSHETIFKWDLPKRGNNGIDSEIVERLKQQGVSKSYKESTKKNRFWTYIGPAHMVNFPHLYSDEVLQKFAPAAIQPATVPEDTSSEGVAPAELDSAGVIHVLDGSAVAELPATDNAIFELSARRSLQRSASTQSDPQSYKADQAQTGVDADSAWLARVQRKHRSRTAPEMTVTQMGDEMVIIPAICAPGPAYPVKQKDFDPGDLETAIRESLG